jgi:glycerol-3-phosphate acyltransferase PlsX
MIRIAVDAMGGDHAPRSIIDGALAAARHLDLGLVLAGPAEVIRAELARHPDADELSIRVLDAPEVIGMSEAPAAALRRKPRASIRVAAESVANGGAAALVSAGHTGATVLSAYGAFGMLPGVDRPALAATIPSGDRLGILLDVGANVGVARRTCCSSPP